MSADHTGASRHIDGTARTAGCWVCSKYETGEACAEHRHQIMDAVREQSTPLPGYDTPGVARSTRRWGRGPAR